MIYAERGNKVITIREDAIEKYVQQGYIIKDESGVVLRETIPTDVPNLRKAYIEHKKEIESLRQQIEELKATAKRTATANVEAPAPDKPQTQTRKKSKTEE